MIFPLKTSITIVQGSMKSSHLWSDATFFHGISQSLSPRNFDITTTPPKSSRSTADFSRAFHACEAGVEGDHCRPQFHLLGRLGGLRSTLTKKFDGKNITRIFSWVNRRSQWQTVQVRKLLISVNLPEGTSKQHLKNAIQTIVMHVFGTWNLHESSDLPLISIPFTPLEFKAQRRKVMINLIRNPDGSVALQNYLVGYI